MKKLINNPEDVVTEELQGIAAAHADLVRVQYGPNVIVRADAPVQGKVGLVSGGGSGHEPMHGGFVGQGMLDAACPGEVFTSPTPAQMLDATTAAHGEPGRERVTLEPSAKIVERLATPIVEDVPFESGDEVLAFVNGMGGTPLIELYVVYNDLQNFLDGRGIKITRNLIGPYITSLEMAGCSITLLKLDEAAGEQDVAALLTTVGMTLASGVGGA